MKAHPTHTPARAIPAPMASAGPMAAAPPVATVFAAMTGFAAAAVAVLAAARDLAAAIVFVKTAAPVSATKDRRGAEIVACTTCLVHAFRTSPRPSLLRIDKKTSVFFYRKPGNRTITTKCTSSSSSMTNIALETKLLKPPGRHSTFFAHTAKARKR